jgi:acyl carrier protein
LVPDPIEAKDFVKQFQQVYKNRARTWRSAALCTRGNDGMTRDEIRDNILAVFEKAFEIANPGLDDDLREAHGFDSIDAIELLGEIEDLLGIVLTQEQKKRAMDNIRTLNQILDYVESLKPEQADR